MADEYLGCIRTQHNLSYTGFGYLDDQYDYYLDYVQYFCSDNNNGANMGLVTKPASVLSLPDIMYCINNIGFVAEVTGTEERGGLFKLGNNTPIYCVLNKYDATATHNRSFIKYIRVPKAASGKDWTEKNIRANLTAEDQFYIQAYTYTTTTAIIPHLSSTIVTGAVGQPFDSILTSAATATNFKIYSTSAEDIATTGNGARTVGIIHYSVATAGAIDIDVYNMNKDTGTDIMATLNDTYGILGLVVLSTGTTGYNEGDIYIKGTTA